MPKSTLVKVYVTRKLPGNALELLKSECKELIVNPHNRPPTKDEIIENIKDKDGMICLLTDKITRDIIDAGKELKIISNYAVGYDNIDVSYATSKGIMVTNTPDVLTHATAELTVALILAVARNIPLADKFAREGKFEGWAPDLLLGTELYNKTLGIIGGGKIGTQVGIKMQGFRMKILYTDLKPNPFLENIGAKLVSFEELLRKSDFITIHIPLTPDTDSLIGKKEFDIMKPTAFIINTARGKIINETALISALKQNKIAGAGLDVYKKEPYIPPELAELSNVVLLPHIGSATFTARENMAKLAVENLLAGLKGKTPSNLVNKPA